MLINKMWKVIAIHCILLVLSGCMEAQWIAENMQEYNRKLKVEAEEKKKYANEPEYTAPLASLPEGVQFPVPLKYKVSYSLTRKALTCRGIMKEEEKNTLLALSGNTSYQDAVNKLYQNALPKPAEIPLVSLNNTDEEKQASTTSPEVILTDGNVIKGNIKDEFDFQTELATLKINGEDIVSYLDGKLKLKDGNILLGKIVMETVKIQTDYGELEASADSIVRIKGE